MTAMTASTTTAPTRFLDAADQRYAYRRFGAQTASAPPLLCLQHFTGTLDNWDPAVTDPLASSRELIFFDNAGVGRSPGTVPPTVAGMQRMRWRSWTGWASSGAMCSDFRLAEWSHSSWCWIDHRYFGGREDRHTVSGPDVANARLAAFREWEHFTGERFMDLRRTDLPSLVVNGVHDEMFPVRNSYWLAEHLPNAVLLIYPDAGHGSLFQWHDSFQQHASRFLASDSPSAPY